MINEQSEKEVHNATLGEIVDSIQFPKFKKKCTFSETESISSSHTVEAQLKEKSKVWTKEQVDLLKLLLNKYGTDYHILSTFFPRKTKNQIKHKHKHIHTARKKQEKQEKLNLMAMNALFKEAEEFEEDN